jgi:UDP-N-acetylmuramate--alanine ligase
MDEFATAFNEADELFLTEIYPASERPIVGITGKRLAETIKEHSSCPVHFVEQVELLPEAASARLQAGDVVMTLGAGAIGRMGPKLLEALREKKSREDGRVAQKRA